MDTYKLFGNTLIYEAKEYQGLPLLNFFMDYQLSKKERYLYLQEKRILIHHQAVKNVNTIIDGPLTIHLREEDIDCKIGNKSIEVIYEDHFVYAAYKEAGIIIHGEEDCFNHRAALYQLEHNMHFPIRPLHRLDKETQGLILLSKIPFFQPYLDHALREKEIKRNYIAICKGRSTIGKEFVIDSPIGRDRHDGKKYRVSKTGKNALTKAKVIKTDKDTTTFFCTLETGRTHQIRVHLASMGFPIVNDPLYGQKDPHFKHMGLWAKEICYIQPLTKERILIQDKDRDLSKGEE